MIISRRGLMSAAVPLSASLVCGPLRAASAVPAEIEALRGKLHGVLYTSSDPSYDIARRGLGSTPVDDRFPAMVVMPADADDIARTLEYARKHDLEISVRSGGHDALGASTTAHGVVIDLSKLNSINVDPATGIARAGAGARSAGLTSAAGRHGLAPVLGMSGHIGLGGVTLGGGIGWLCGSHGATVDNLLDAEIVTADGRLLRANAQENPDLFWALRGGGGNFGVATAFTYRMQPVTQVLAGSLSFKTDVAQFLKFLKDFLAASPDALDIAVLVPAAAGPANLHMAICWSGSPDEGERVLAPLKAFSPPVADKVKLQSFSVFANASSAAYSNLFWRGGEMDGLSDAAIDVIADIFDGTGPEACGINILHYMHGALCRVPMAATPLIRRDGAILYNIIAAWAGPTHPRDKEQWVLNAAEKLKAVNSRQTYINYLSYEGAGPVRDAYGPHFKRLSHIKRTYDPHNMFRNNRNVRI